MAHDIENELQTHAELEAWLREERKELQETADRCKAALEATIAERNKAKKEYPGLLKEVEAKKKLLESLPSEISELEGRLFAAERSKDDDETGSFSRIKRAREEFERAQYRAQSFVASKMEEIKQLIQA
jgi:chromosome segregation ATPase